MFSLFFSVSNFYLTSQYHQFALSHQAAAAAFSSHTLSSSTSSSSGGGSTTTTYRCAGHSMIDVIRLLGNPVEATTFVQNVVLLLVEHVV
jgi:hypothetical protein